MKIMNSWADSASSLSNPSANNTGFRWQPSSLLTAADQKLVLQWEAFTRRMSHDCPGHWLDPAALHDVRHYFDHVAYAEIIQRQQHLYPVDVRSDIVDGVSVSIFAPKRGIAEANRSRVLINLHAGALMVCQKSAPAAESIPIASLGGVEVISVDYRMAPEWKFPAATDDILIVYRNLLKQFSPQHIGIFGCSAGAVLAAQTLSRLQNEQLPLPGAVVMTCGAASYWGHGDSAHIASTGQPGDGGSFHSHPYFADADPYDPLVQPIYSDDVLKKFPPSLLLAATRDFAMSSVVHTHARLTSLGVDASLHIWEGLDHNFHYNPDLPQSQQVYALIARFFHRHLRMASA